MADQLVQRLVATMDPIPTRQYMSLLPNEVLFLVLRVLFYMQLVRCRRVCKRFCTIIDNTAFLQYIIELGAAGYTPDRALTSGVGKALQTFRRAQLAYRNPRPTAGTVETLTHGPLSIDKWSQWKRAGDHLVSVSKSRKMLAKLNIGSDCQPYDRLSTLKVTFQIANTAINVSQSLLILVDESSKLHFRSLKSGLVHRKLQADAAAIVPRATDTAPGVLFHWLVLEVWEEWLLLSFQYGDSPLTRRQRLYHWPSGRLIREWAIMEIGGCLFDGFVILPGSPWDGSTRVTDAAPGPMWIAVYKLPDCRDLRAQQTPEVVCLTKYLLPTFSGNQLRPTTHYWSGRLDGSKISCLKLLAFDATTPRYLRGCRQADRLLSVATLGTDNLVVPISALVTESLRCSSSSTPSEIPWQVWGPSKTSLVKELPSPDQYSSLAREGMHMVLGDRIVTFNQYELARGTCVSATSSEHTQKGANCTSACTHGLGPAVLVEKLGEDQGRLYDILEAKMSYRISEIQIPKDEPTSARFTFFLEEADGPKFVEVLENEQRGLYGLRYRKF